METPTPTNQNTEPKIPQETMVTLQFPQLLKKLFKMYVVVFFSLVCTAFITVIISQLPSPYNVRIPFILTILLIGVISFITGTVAIIKCILSRKNLTYGEKIVGHGVSILTIVIPNIICYAIFYFVLIFNIF